MTSKRTRYYIAYAIIFIGLIVSTYLLLHHFSLMAGKPFTTDLCSVIFGKGCNNAAMSSLSTFLHIPVGGWGMIYLVMVGCFILFSQVLVRSEEDEMIQIAFWISLAGILFSAFYLLTMILYPMLFCPFCTVFHVLNFLLFFMILRIARLSPAKLAAGLRAGINHVLLAKPMGEGFIRWKWIAYLFPLVLGLVIYQWSQIEGLSVTNKKLAAYDPLAELEKYESREFRDINVTPDDPLLGPADAPVTMVVFSDLQCPVCGMFAANFTDLITFNKGKLNIRFKHFPISTACNPLTKQDLHPMACQAAKAAEAARLQGKFWAYHDSIYIHKELEKGDESMLVEVARSVGLDMDRFQADRNSPACAQKITSDVTEGMRLKLDGTPTAFLNGRQVFDLRAPSLNFLIKYLAH
jgi:protein-disulfide isomerase/uncharacterized membrane protein